MSFISNNDRTVNFNRFGAYFFYYGYERTTTHCPSPYKQDAVTFWELDWRDQQYMDSVGAAGTTFFFPQGIPFATPNTVRRIVINLPMIQSYGNVNYYTQGPGIWVGAGGDYNRMIEYIMTHEFGHSIGMLDRSIPPKTIMWESVPVNFNGNGQCFYDPTWLLDFSTSDKDSVTIND